MGGLYYDFHIHSCLSPCGDEDMTPANIAGMAFLNGLQAIALTDHNTTGNCAALKKAAEQYGLTVLFGMELTTAEEVHTVCLFPDAETAGEWEEYVRARLIKLENNPDIFGRQLFMDAEDHILGEEPYLLINATEIAFEDVFEPVERLGGVAFPAHVDKNANSLISNLGFVPPDSRFPTAEISRPDGAEQLMLAHPYFKECRMLTDSDAHYLPDIGRAVYKIEPEDPSPAGIIRYLRGQG